MHKTKSQLELAREDGKEICRRIENSFENDIIGNLEIDLNIHFCSVFYFKVSPPPHRAPLSVIRKEACRLPAKSVCLARRRGGKRLLLSCVLFGSKI